MDGLVRPGMSNQVMPIRKGWPGCGNTKSCQQRCCSPIGPRAAYNCKRTLAFVNAAETASMSPVNTKVFATPGQP
jgi:hypothetical protein